MAPRRHQLAELSVCSGVSLAVLVGDVPVNNVARVLRSSASVLEEDIQAACRRAEDALEDLKLLLAWYPQEAIRTSEAADYARRAVATGSFAKGVAAQTAERLRDLLDLDDEEPVGDIAELIENLGAAVIFEPLPEPIQGVTVRDLSQDSWQAVVLVNSTTWWGRQRYTLAHELCHILYRDSHGVFVNRKDDEDMDDAEIRAESFARHFLAPDLAVREFWSEHAPRGVYDTYGVALAKFMMHFGLSRRASVRTLVEVADVPEEAMGPYTRTGARIETIMREAGLEEQWNRECATQHARGASNWCLSMALDAYRQSLVGVPTVARVLGRSTELVEVERELCEQGYRPTPR
ncbi:ImmA/IrrE family metallo-endopeptidase [Solwaraspora sp. WMMD791]|uniref:ImmA/IrrE family metallo-endopeptidase n=1 Tax=Solwaraspora sp. WMMD791 TaxID=3016086 RepID=UPI00249B18E0|nr:ImmA/IrrE family metallo-endopeptidase [Solwaraspora sp. WMMD791]WFE27696.1 ImmA/IrrE family metallo-endopeptidase [Solwaraspora sp. WMMD791]